MDFLTLITAVGFSSPSIPAPPPPPEPPPIEEQEEEKARKSRLAKIAARKRGRQSLIATGNNAAGDTSVAPSFAPTLGGSTTQTLG